ncbi:MAG: YqgE/AlgH family protein [Salinivirgaceae bacterium]|nr:YqgE/AlgH family protein [Salinivirgaceae bacterium]MDD4746196.1 YqgE/AlgH family protein [Salinivirgaceae bacterium]MDY0282737.1 YqgE/AlgH family protein [Salinivirgaceae bacterium]
MDIFNQIFELKEDPKKVKEGMILISEPLGRDLFFKKSVVLIVEHNSVGTVGFVLNKPFHFPIKELINDFPNASSFVSLGGPVEPDTLHFLHTEGNIIEDAKEVIPGIFWGGDFEQLQQNVHSGAVDTQKVRFFLGYSGWAPGQLDEEIKNSQWIVSSISNLEILNSPMEMWEKCVFELGDRFKAWLNVPEVPTMN